MMIRVDSKEIGRILIGVLSWTEENYRNPQLR
jgi:hypothetical protein